MHRRMTMRAIVFRDFHGLNNPAGWISVAMALACMIGLEGLFSANLFVGFMLGSFAAAGQLGFCPTFMIAKDREWGVCTAMHLAGLTIFRYVCGKVLIPVLVFVGVYLTNVMYVVCITGILAISADDIVASLCLGVCQIITQISVAIAFSLSGSVESSVWKMSLFPYLGAFFLLFVAIKYWNGILTLQECLILFILVVIASMISDIIFSHYHDIRVLMK